MTLKFSTSQFLEAVNFAYMARKKEKRSCRYDYYKNIKMGTKWIILVGPKCNHKHSYKRKAEDLNAEK
jgi:hypothetical protein